MGTFLQIYSILHVSPLYFKVQFLLYFFPVETSELVETGKYLKGVTTAQSYMFAERLHHMY